MKKAKKILFVILTLALLVFPMTAFAATDADDGYGSSEEATQTPSDDSYNSMVAKWLESNFFSLNEEELKYYEKNSTGDSAEFYQSYLKILPSLGDYKETDEKNITGKSDKDTKKFHITVISEFEKGDLETNVEISTFSSNIAPTKTEFNLVDQNVSFGEKMGKAGLNTLMGMGTVFIVLIFISFIISLLPLVSNIGQKKKEEDIQTPVVEAEEESVPEEEEELVDDTELVAVISAAIAASEQTSTDGFVVRSIRKRR